MKYIFYPNCKIVFGHRRAIIYDLFRLRYKILPLELANIINEYQKKEIEQIDFSKEDFEVFNSFINELCKDDYVFMYEDEKYNLFADLSLNFESPENITSVIVKFSEVHLKNIKELISILENSNVKNLHLICEMPLDNVILKIISDETKNTQLEYIEISSKEKATVNSAFVTILNKNSRISNIFASNVIYNKGVKKPKWCSVVSYKSQIFLNSMRKKKAFRVNKSLYCESQKFNTFFNKKVFIDEFGSIVKTFGILFLFLSLKLSAQTINIESYNNFANGDSLFSTQNYSSAIPYYEKALKVNLNHNSMFYKLALCYKNCGFYEKAFKAIEFSTKNGMYFLDTNYVRKDTNLAACFKFKPKKITDSIYRKIIANCLNHSPHYKDSILFFSESKKLLSMKKIDQENRNGNAVSDSLWKKQKEKDKSNQIELISILKKMNWPGIIQVGSDASVVAFLIAQHSENIKFQKECLNRMYKELKYKNISLSHFAYLYDRIQLQQSNQQLFGTQVEYKIINNKELAVAKPLLNPTMVNVLRFYFQLPPLEEYLNQMNKQFK